MKVQEVTRRIDSDSAMKEVAEELNVYENQLRNALKELGHTWVDGRWGFEGNIGLLFKNKDKSIFEFVSRTEETNFTSEQVLMLKQIANHYIKEERLQKLKMEISNEISKLPAEQGIRTKVVINKAVLEKLNAFSSELELRESDIIGVALSHFFDKYKIDKVE
ncbi:hypothetical protein [Bacillus wiedmannii]|uniref:hypothetical protein n=1 Tax=Bacillus wiedmannii TaxID=1890302 RepID=UPI003F925388